ncbi:RdgB/HAM1 family non-canonical purine NTP pyrophosphatase [Aureliella helgolandensis]|uniref:dITP/XTP pyrophosphatase n=1 Tax=Aureliella helgolandensis TaxID=2527968 RepID=A0A518GDH3_9BACT|nr:RdgB/HAM1 family non-canonical purine NTP pyrophosphatase [Aureliella helgolandensis]QDV26654.1 Non-canonical purine NTP pyrophosphatase [Aureliella helgolandensis]
MSTSPQPTALPIKTLILGTSNAKKCVELRRLLQPLGLQLQSLAEVDDPLEVEETGATFIENARLKASEQAQHLGQWTIGEDSGLCVPYLDGAPGIFSARYSDPGATDIRNNEKLLAELSGAAGPQRRAYYICTIALASPDGRIHLEAEGKCRGRIIEAYRGSGGFGYDPLFEIPEYHQTFAELGGSVKAVLSHRARALEHFTLGLRQLIT